MWTNFWLVLYTWLQHTNENVPQYGQDEWTWLKGAMSTIDRPYTGVDWMHHHIGSTHVVHHLFSYLPCYHAQEATKHIKEILGVHYNYDSRNFVKAAFQTAKSCQFVLGIEGTQYFSSFKE